MSLPSRRLSTILTLVVLGVLMPGFLSKLLVHTPAAATSSATITLSVSLGSPGSTITLTGRGFDISEAVTITFDKVVSGTTTTSTAGTFSTRVMIPSSALPGTHQVQAVGESSQLTALASFLVNTNWVTDGYDAQRVTSFAF